SPSAEPTAEPTAVPTPVPAATTPASVVATKGDPAGTILAFYQLISGHDYASALGMWSDRMRATYPPQTNIWGRFDRTRSIVSRLKPFMKGFTRAMGEGVRRVTIHDVAGKAGVSTAAVSHAFNDPERLRATTVTRILDAARELGYAPNPHARALHSQRVGVLGVLFPQPIATVFANPFFASFLEGIGSVTDERGIGLLTVTPVGGSLERAIAAAPVDGFVIIGLDERHADVTLLHKRGVPFVVVDGDAETASSVNVDDEGGAHAAADLLLDRGHREILVLTFHAPPEELDKDLGVRGRRLRGYRRAFVD